MKILIAADIFGDTPELHATASGICANFSVVSPYEDNLLELNNEKRAYTAFQNCGGVEAYAEKLIRQTSSYQPDVLIGFSVGATASWLALSESIGRTVKLGVLFYGSRIREFLHLRPQCKTRLIFAEYEKSFDAKQLVATLIESGVSAEICPGTRHGFMNPLSTGYDSISERKGIEWGKSALNGLPRLNDRKDKSNANV